MPPSTALATLRPDIAESLLEFDPTKRPFGLIGYEILRPREVFSQKGTYGIIKIEDLKKTRSTRRRARSGYNRGDFEFDDVAYNCAEHGLEGVVDDSEAAMYADYFDMEVEQANITRQDVLLAAEVRIAAAVFDTATWTGASLFTNVTNEWDDFANATPIEDVAAAKIKIWTNSGMTPNAGICSYKVFENLRQCTNFLSRVSASGAGDKIKPVDITAEMAAQALGLNRLLIGGETKNTATEGQAASLAGVWDDEYFMVCRVAETDSMKEPCIGRTLHWGADGSQVGGAIETYRDESVRSDIVRVRHQVDEKIHYAEAGHLLGNITS